MRSGSSLEIQHGGSHYKGKAVQPVEFWAANGWDGFSASILKYITRWRDKGGLVDLRKALHFAELRMELRGAIEVKRVIKMTDYCKSNFPDWNEYWREAAALAALEVWVLAGEAGNDPLDLRHKMFTNNLTNLIEWVEETHGKA